MKNTDTPKADPTAANQDTNWFLQGRQEGLRFAREDAEFRDLAAIHRAGGIPAGWDLFRAELLNQHLGEKGFDFQQYTAGFVKACLEFYDQI